MKSIDFDFDFESEAALYRQAIEMFVAETKLGGGGGVSPWDFRDRFAAVLARGDAVRQLRQEGDDYLRKRDLEGPCVKCGAPIGEACTGDEIEGGRRHFCRRLRWMLEDSSAERDHD
jgi:hypothetical protein